jgi:hypothetical protein
MANQFQFVSSVDFERCVELIPRLHGRSCDIEPSGEGLDHSLAPEVKWTYSRSFKT